MIETKLAELLALVNIVCTTKRPGVNQAEPTFYDFLVQPKSVDPVKFVVHKDYLNYEHIVEFAMETCYFSGIRAGEKKGEKELQGRIKRILDV